MNKALSLFIGLRYHRVKNSNGFVSFISASSTLGIMLGVAVLIIGLSVMNGFERELKERFLAIISHGELEAVDQPLRDLEQRLDGARANADVLGAAPYITLSGLAQRGKKMKALSVKGIDPQQEQTVSKALQFMSSDAAAALALDQAAIVLGQGVAEQIGVAEGQSITLLVPKKAKGKLSSPKRVRLKVVGLLKAGGQLDNQLGFINLDYARELVGWEQGASGISIRVTDPLQAERVIREVGNLSPQLVYLKSWNRTHGYLYQDIQMVRTVMYVIMLLIVAVASFNIVSTLVLAVSDKRSDIAILKTMGMSDASLIKTFIVYGSYNGILGCLLGVLLGLLGVYSLPSLLAWLEQALGRSLLSGDIYFIDFLPILLQWSDVLMVGGAAFVLSLLATLWPSWQATKIQPAQVLGG